MTDKEIQIDLKALSDGYDQGYEDCKNDLIAKACKWLIENRNALYNVDINGFIMLFRKAMEE